MQPLNLCSPMIGGLEKRLVRRCLESGFVSSVGPMIAEFEQAFAKRIGVKHAVATASGTAALHTALLTLGIGPQHRVMVPDLTFVASVNPVLYCGAQPLLSDVRPETWTLDPEIFLAMCRRRRSLKPAAVMPVHLYGCPCEMEEIRRIAREYDVAIVEDATEALGTMIGRRSAGAWGDIGCFSFNGNKMMTSGGGGMLVTDSAHLAERARHLVNQARCNNQDYRHDMIGHNYRMTNLTAALGLAQLQRLDDLLRRKRRIGLRYARALADQPGIATMPEPPGTHNCFWLYSILLSGAAGRRRLADRLASQAIPSRHFFTPLHRQPYLRLPLWGNRRGRAAAGDRGRSDDLAARGLNLPSSPEMPANRQKDVIRAILS